MATRQQRYLTAPELAEYLHIQVETINWWRKLYPPRGPRHVKFGRRVRYLVTEVEQYEADPQEYDRKRALEVEL